MADSICFISQNVAKLIDVDLVENCGFSIPQLMELAGLAVAQSIFSAYPKENFNKVLVICGPGNNGGDGLVAARHLVLFGYSVTVIYPKATTQSLFLDLQKQCISFEIPIFDKLPETFQEFHLILDAIFGFSFSGAVRSPFDSILKSFRTCNVPIASIDVPSGWDIDLVQNDHEWTPNMVVSLTAAKFCMKSFKGLHFIGGRFIPASVCKKFNFQPVNYEMDKLYFKYS